MQPRTRQLFPSLVVLTTVFFAGFAQAGVTLNVVLTPDPARPSEPVHGRVIVANDGGGSVANISVRVTMPATVSFFNPALIGVSTGIFAGCSATGTSYCDPSEVTTWTIGTLPAGATAMLTMRPTVSVTATTGTLVTLDAELVINAIPSGTASRTVTVSTANALSLNVDNGVDSVAPGALLTYDLSYGNRSINPLTGTALTFPIPAGATFVSASGGGSFSAGAVTWSIGPLTAGESGRQQVVVTAGGGLGHGQLLVVDAAAISGTGTGPETADAQAITAIKTAQPLGVGLEVTPDPVRASERMRAQLTVTNRSGATLTNVTAMMRLPDTMAQVFPEQFTGGPGTVTGCLAFGSANCDAGELVTWTVGTLPAGASSTLSVRAQLAPTAADGLLTRWEAIVASDGNNVARASRSVAADSGSALSLNLDENLDTVAPGATLTYDLSYGNRGISSLTGTTLSFPIPIGAAFVSASGGGSLSGGVVTWNLGTLTAGDVGRQQVVVTAGAGLVDGELLVADAATITGTGATQENARALAITAVRTVQPLGLALEVNPDPVRTNEPMHVLVTVTNRGGTSLSGVTVLMRPPDPIAPFPEVLFTGGPGILPGCGAFGSLSCDAGEVMTWTIGTLPAGAGATLSVRALLAPGTADGVLAGWDVIVLANGNNIARLSHTVAADSTSNLLIDVDDSVDAVAPGGTLSYDLIYGNRGITSLTGATLSFPIPAGTTLVSNTGGTVTGSTVNWNLGTLAAGQGGRRRVVASIGAGANPGDVLAIDAAQISGTGTIVKTTRSTAATRIGVAPALRLVSSVAPNPVQHGQTLTATYTLTNTTGSSLAGVLLHARVPNFVTTFVPTLLSPSGPGCSAIGSANCDPYEVVTWSVGSLGAGASYVASMPPVVLMVNATGAPLNGQLIPVVAVAEDSAGDSASTTNTALVNPFTDSDFDVVADVFDNCTAVPNADQRDTNGDGFGSICDPDFNGDGTVNINDFNRLKARLGITPVVDVDTDLDGNGAVNINDLNRLKSFLGKPPGPSALAP